MKFNLDGWDYEWYELSNRQMVDLIKGDTLTEEERTFLTAKLVDRFENETCPKVYETNLNVFARQFSNFVNGKCGYNYKETAELLARDHRYLQQEMFKVMLEYIKILAENAENGFYDPRNEWACNAAKYMIDGLKTADYPY